MEQQTAYRRPNDAQRPACASHNDARPGDTGRVVPYAGSADEPIRRPDYKAKKHTKPKKWQHADVRRQCERAVEAALFGEVE